MKQNQRIIPSESEILLQLTSFDRQNFDDVSKISDTTPALEYISNVLDSKGIEVQFQEYERRSTNEQKEEVIKKRKNLIARIHEQDDLPTICFQGHVDTVPIGDYERNPWGYEEGDRIYGRGVVDMSGSLSCMIAAMLQATEISSPRANIQLVITSDEEAHNFEGIKRFLEEDHKIDLAICGEPTSMEIKDRFKGALYYIVNIKGKSGHGSRQHEGENAIVKSMPILQELGKLYTYIPTVTNKIFQSDDIYTEQSSMNMGVIRAGTKVNTIPDSMKIEFEMRLVKPAAVYHKLIADSLSPYQHLIEKTHLIFAEDPVIAHVNQSNPFYEVLAQISERRVVATGFSEAKFMNQAGIPTIEFGVGDNTMAHSKEEYVSKKDLQDYTQKLLSFVRRI